MKKFAARVKSPFANGKADAAKKCLEVDHDEIVVATDGDGEKLSSSHSQHHLAGEQRENWSNQLDFLMFLIAFAVGLGNVWRFPYLCYKNGGGVFLVPYLICWFFGAVPIFYLEVAAGQFLRRGGIEVWRCCPLFKGVGIANVILSFLVCIYYNVIITWALYYLLSSFQTQLPWLTCDNPWNINATCIEDISILNSTNHTNSSLKQTPVEQFWEHKVLETGDHIGDTTHVVWQLAALLLLAYVLVYFALWKGITEARKLVYFCALSPYVLLFILLARGASLPGAMEGIKFYVKPDITALLRPTVWKDAGTQVFYSYGIGFGALMALGSYNRYNHDCTRDVFAVAFINMLTSILAGFVVFSVLGYMAFVSGKTVDQVVKGGVGLAFLVYPEIVASLPISQLWSVMFFLMIIILGMDSMICQVEAVMTPLRDHFLWVRKNKELSMLFMCIILYLLGLPMVTSAGQYWVTLVDTFGASGFALLFIVFFEAVGLSWGFGAKRLLKAIEDMVGHRPGVIWLYSWKYTSPALCVIIFVFTAIFYEPLEYADKTPYPVWSQVLGFLMSATSMSAIPAWMVYYIWKSPGRGLVDKFRRSLRPAMAIPWGEDEAEESQEMGYRKGRRTVEEEANGLVEEIQEA